MSTMSSQVRGNAAKSSTMRVDMIAKLTDHKALASAGMSTEVIEFAAALAQKIISVKADLTSREFGAAIAQLENDILSRKLSLACLEGIWELEDRGASRITMMLGKVYQAKSYLFGLAANPNFKYPSVPGGRHTA